MTPSLGIKSRPHWWEVSALTSAPPLLLLTLNIVTLSLKQVNAEIKRLLVASVGEDIGNKYWISYCCYIHVSTLLRAIPCISVCFLGLYQIINSLPNIIRVEDLVNRNVQQTVELNHWKKMCEEYSEESDRLEIECDVWRTKFLASRLKNWILMLIILGELKQRRWWPSQSDPWISYMMQTIQNFPWF